MTLQATLNVHIGSFELTADVEVEPGTTLALLGPNGAGKSTALRALAGLRPLTKGTIELGGRTVDAPEKGVFVPPERRSVGVVFQDYLLFGHMSAVDNVAFGLRARGTRKREANATAVEWLDRVGLAAQARHKPRQLSGGQAQRVALARALAIQPDLLLLDEPLAALDAATRIQIRAQLRKHLDDYEGSTVLVTHDPLDAMILADRLLVVENGSVVQAGSPAEIARRPRTDYIAALVGLNLYRGTADGVSIKLDDGSVLTTAHSINGPVFVTFPPNAVSLHKTRPDGSPRNTWLAEVAGIEQHADTVRVRLTGTPDLLADVTTAAVAELTLTPGQQVWVTVKATETHAYPI
ncbi:sulfate/molybdate ABC transporter ATP-binding protein [Kibdelosporangium phytohabitans]|uniref:ABC transporter ATP-binding protein n=1 Tax=Kibdelosporangium phytohabitans TaxID=860235 RepID=A0A0N9HYL1_9PSEU|nr:ATP-binding cassette domain-containing protein [Kibdelosporangium phytohabitans]ALG07204.1 ABC transporter ATP-binding protein [Kibdelosporangium phytohabitans]MBE1471948.1 molybdate transport system ATP-binding protein [Kibdelosporangium phytohabitans]